MKNKYLTLAISIVLSFAIMVNSASFRKDTYAFIPAFAGVAAAASGGTAVAVSSEAVAVLVGIVAAGLGIVVGSSEEGQALVNDFITNICKDKTADEVASTFEGFGFDCTITEGSCAVDVKDTKKTGITVSPDGRVGYENVINVNFGEYTEPTGDGGGSGDPDNNNDNKSNKIAGYLMAASSIFSIGKEFYNYLHNSSDVNFVGGFKADLGTHNDIVNYSRNLYINNNLYMLTPEYYDMLYAGVDDLEEYLFPRSFKYYDFYYFNKPYNVHFNDTFYDDYTYSIIAVLCTDVDDKLYYYYSTSFSPFVKDPYYDRTSYYNTGTGGVSEAVDNSAGDLFDRIITFWSYFHAHLKLSDFEHVSHFVNTDLVSDSDLSSISGSDSLRVGDKDYKLEDDNIYKNPDFTKDNVNPFVNPKGEVLSVVPQVNLSTGELVYPGGNPFINTEGIDPVLDSDISEDTHNNQNIFTLLENFIKNFFAKLGTLLKSLFVPDFSSLVNQFSSLKDKFPIIAQVDTLVDKLINFNYSKAPPDFKISYNSKTLGYTSEKISFFNYKIFDDYLPILHSIILFVSYFFFCKKVATKITKIFQP